MKKIIRFLILSILSYFLVTIVSYYILGMLRPLGLLSSSAMELFLPYVLNFGLWIVVMMALSRRMKWKIPTITARITRVNFPLILLSMIVIEAVNFISEPLIALLPDTMIDTLYATIEGGFWAMLTSVVAAPILEEIAFRGIFQQNFSRYLGRVWGVMLGAIVFGAIHIIPQQALGAFLIGIVISLIYEITNSLSTVIVIHFLNNGLAYIFMMAFGSEVSGLGELLGLSGTTYWVVYGICSVVVLVFGYLCFRRVRRMDSPNIVRVALEVDESM